MLVSVILSGGSGTRLWPLSRELSPKQFLNLYGEKSLLEVTADRLDGLVERGNLYVVAGASQASGMGYKTLKNFKHVVEPVARNTAPAIAVMAAYLADFENDPVMLILPADHVIKDLKAFHAAIKTAEQAAEQGHLVTFGLRPTYAETGFGYIKAMKDDGHAAYAKVEAFVEKPGREKAEAFLKDGNYYWNSGMFVARASVLLTEIATHSPELAKVLDSMRAAWTAANWKEVITQQFGQMPSISIDYAVMEKSDNVVTVPCSLDWSDVGSWDAVHELADKDADGNAVPANHIGIDTKNVLVMGETRLIATVGIEDLCIIDTPDALLITKHGQSQHVKAIVEEVKKRGGEQHIVHQTAYRPWGSYTVLEDGGMGFKVKRIEVVPGGRLSLQSHKHRSEHWVVVSGEATITCGDKVMTLHPNQSTYIPLGEKHRLENMGTVPVQMVEVQVGDYLGEDDIERFDDVYGRS